MERVVISLWTQSPMEGGLWMGRLTHCLWKVFLGRRARAEPAGVLAPPSALSITRIETRPGSMMSFP